ncbi:MAG: hypothetical protein ABJI09_00435, partial [Marinomonas sp.]
MDVLKVSILAQARIYHAAVEEELKLFPAWIGWRAAVARDSQRAAGVCNAAAVFQREITDVPTKE